MAVNYGSKRTVVGAGYGTSEWVGQLATGLVMALYTLAVLVRWCWPRMNELGEKLVGYEQWASVFSPQWMKVFTFAIIIALAYHAWAGFRSIAMDYVKAAGLRLLLQIAALVWLAGCAGWMMQVLWSI
jgi:succinate dehydrogenase / fumarate reductase membrane anchor subunit